MEIVLNIIVNFTCILTGLWNMSRIMGIKKDNYILRSLGISALAISQAFVSLLHISLLNTLSLLFMIIGSTIIFIKYSKFHFLIYDVLIAVSAFAADITSTLCLSVISENTILLTLQQKNLIVARYLLTCIMTFIFCNLAFSILKRKHTTIKAYEIVFYVILATAEALSSAYIVKNIQETSSGTFMILFLLGCFVLDIYVVLMFYRISKSRETERENDLLKQQSNLQMSVYRDLQQRYAVSMKIVHDAKKHVNALEGLIEISNTVAAEQYKNSLYHELDKLHPPFYCENQLLAVIINNALLKAEQQQIIIHTQIEHIDFSFLSDIDLTTIVSNILDNALEAVVELPKNMREIWFIMEKKMGCYLIHSENSYNYINNISGRKFLSTKQNHMGIGLTNIESAVQKYDGVLSIDIKNKKFIVSITIPEKR